MKKSLLSASKIICASLAPLLTIGVIFQSTAQGKQHKPQEDPKLWSLLNIEEDGKGNVILKGFKDSVTFNDINDTKEKVLIIPPQVTEIASMAFPYIFDGIVVKNIESVDFSLATNLKKIGNGAFYWCKGLVSRTLAPSDIDLSNNIKLESIGDQAFAFSSFDGVVKFPESLTKIGNNAFESCEQLSGELNFPKNLTSMGDYAFKNCVNISTVNLTADESGYIPDWMYDYSLALKNVGTKQKSTKPICNIELRNNSIENWKYVLFNRLALSDSMFDIVPGGFTDSECFNLDENRGLINGFSSGAQIDKYNVFQLPNQGKKGRNLTTIQAKAFAGSSSIFIEDIFGPVWTSTSKLFPIVFNDETNITTIRDEAFQWAGNLKGALILPKTLKNLGSYAFQRCVSLEEVDFSKIEGQLETNDSIFSGCFRIRNLILSPKIKSAISGQDISSMFSDNLALYWIDMSTFDEDPPIGWTNTFSFNSEATIPHPYDYYPKLLLLPKDANMSDDPDDDGWPTFLKDNGYDYKNHSNLHIAILENLENELARNMLLIDGDHVIRDIVNKQDPKWQTIGKITLPEDVMSIDKNVFKDMFHSDDASIKYLLHINDGLRKIGDNAFENCNALVCDFLYPSSLTWIGDNAFAGCTNMYQNFHLPPNLKHLGSTPWPKDVLMSCNEFKIPDTLEYAGGMAFGDLKIYAQQTKFRNDWTIVVPPSLQTTTHVGDNSGPFAGVCNYNPSSEVEQKLPFYIDISAFGRTKPAGWDPYTLWVNNGVGGQIYVQRNTKSYWDGLLSKKQIYLAEGWSFEEKP